MKPSQLASQLRRIASAIDNSKSPDRTLVARDLKKVLQSINGRIAGDYFPNGERFTIVPSSGVYKSEFFAGPVSYKLENVGYVSEESFSDLRGSISIDGSPWININASASGRDFDYHLSSDDPNFDAEAFDKKTQDDAGVNLAEVLWQCIDKAIRKYIKENGIVYNENDGPCMDLRVENNEVYDDDDTGV